jgi:hypothetical protein
MIVVPWHNGESLNILNIYAPNRLEERDKMWKELRKKWADEPQLPFPTVALGTGTLLKIHLTEILKL